ncbi:hypothetical protein CR513_51754, partial [Mucuna pruriens]
MVEDKVVILGLNELPNLVDSSRFDYHNYLQWAQSIRTSIKERKKLSHIEGGGPPRDDPKQGTLSVTEYYGTLNGSWNKLDYYQGLKMCKVDSIAYTGLVEKGRIFKFLQGLNYEYDPIRVQILGKEKFSSLSEVFSTVQGEDPHKQLKEFHIMCSTIRSHGILEDYIKMKTFPFSLDGVAKEWLYAFDQAGKERKLQLQELKELCLEAYENSKIYKEKVKCFDDNMILRKEFKVGKLHSKWDGPFVISNVYPYGIVEIRYGTTDKIFKVNGHQLKLFHESPIRMEGDMEDLSLSAKVQLLYLELQTSKLVKNLREVAVSTPTILGLSLHILAQFWDLDCVRLGLINLNLIKVRNYYMYSSKLMMAPSRRAVSHLSALSIKENGKSLSAKTSSSERGAFSVQPSELARILYHDRVNINNDNRDKAIDGRNTQAIDSGRGNVESNPTRNSLLLISQLVPGNNAKNLIRFSVFQGASGTRGALGRMEMVEYGRMEWNDMCWEC